MAKLIIRCDASARIGAGHLTRCLALACELKRIGIYSVFLSRNTLGSLAKTIHDAGLQLELLPADLNDDDDLRYSLKIALNYDAWGIIVDHYDLTSEYLEGLHNNGLIVVAIDDLAAHPFLVDILINQNINARELNYVTRIDTVKLLGLDYVLLRPAFVSTRTLLQRQPRNIKNTLITMGGTDYQNLTLKILAAIELIPIEIKFYVVVGSLCPTLDQIKAVIKNNPGRYKLFIDVSDEKMAQIMGIVDLAIHTCGSTFWELFCLGVPSISIIVAENQRMATEKISKIGVTKCLGWYEEVRPENILSAFNELARDHTARWKMTQTMMSLVDGRGAERIAAQLKNYWRK